MIETEKLNLEGKLLFEFESELIQPNEESAITCMPAVYLFQAMAFYVPAELAASFHVKSISSFDALINSAREEPKDRSSALFSWSCKHDECLGTARSSDDTPLSTAIEAESMMQTCLCTHFDLTVRALRLYPHLPMPRSFTLNVRNIGSEAKKFRIVIIGTEIESQRETLLGLGMAPVRPGERAIFRAMPQLAVRPHRLIVPDLIAAEFMIHDLRIGDASQFAAPGSIPASVFGPASMGTRLELPDVGPGMEIALEVENIGKGTANFMGSFMCTAGPSPTVQDGEEIERLRKELSEIEITSHVTGSLFPQTQADELDDDFDDDELLHLIQENRLKKSSTGIGKTGSTRTDGSSQTWPKQDREHPDG